ncbi:MAG: restriction endonuclease, partial [Chloroflexi bacterium]|nr:restriction endonuclease [Chloroflexota bacterium]
MGILERWGVTLDEINDILAERPSVRGILLGFIAEYKLAQIWFSNDPRVDSLERYKNHDRTRAGDLGFRYKGVLVSVQVKSLQSSSVLKTETGYKGTLQCDASDRRLVHLPNGESVETTCLLVGGFDLLAVNLFEFGQEWRFAFAKNSDLPRTTSSKYTPEQREFLLATSVRITWPLQPPFYEDPFTVL